MCCTWKWLRFQYCLFESFTLSISDLWETHIRYKSRRNEHLTFFLHLHDEIILANVCLVFVSKLYCSASQNVPSFTFHKVVAGFSKTWQYVTSKNYVFLPAGRDEKLYFAIFQCTFIWFIFFLLLFSTKFQKV